MARELHDTIAHGVSVMVLQAGAAEQVMTSAPDQARQAAHAVQDVGRSVLEELSRLLGILHTDEEDSPRAPQPGLAQLDALVQRVRKAGLPVSCGSTASRPGCPGTRRLRLSRDPGGADERAQARRAASRPR